MQNGLSDAQIQPTEPALLQTVAYYTQEARERSLERAIGSIVRYKAVEWAVHVDNQGLLPSSLPPPLLAPSKPSISLVRRCKDGNAGYDPLDEPDELRRFYGRCVTTARIASGRRSAGFVWGLVGTEMDENAITPVS